MDLETTVIRVIHWNAAAAELLSQVNGLALSDVQREVTSGISQLWECTDDRGIAGYVVTRLEQTALGREWVWLACAGRDYHAFVFAFLGAARDNDLPVRVYVRRQGMRRIYEKLGFVTDATVMRLYHGTRRQQKLA